MMMIQSGFQLFIFMIFADIAMTLKDVRIRVPVAVKRGDNVNLTCLYDLEGDTLYSVKWYKGKREFFRFTPKENPSLQVFPVPGIYVEASASNRSQILIKSVEPSISGKYSCEISADAPSFHTSIVGGEMEVVDVPQSKPVITEIKNYYRVGEILKGNCSAQYSKPATNLTWLVNDKPITSSFVRQYKSIKDEHRNLDSSTIGIFLRLSHQSFLHGHLKISCIAKLYDLYNERVDKYIDEERPNVLLASASPVGLNFASQSLFDLPSSQFSSYHDNDEATHNQNDAQIQGE
ncbi:unnamed protein product [Diamesa serratosioi]